MTISVRELCSILGSAFHGPAEMAAYQVSMPLTDSRSLVDAAGTVFFALRTPTGDGHNYINHLYARGVRVFVCDLSRVPHPAPDAVWIHCPDPLAALQALASHIRSGFRFPVIGVTGSIGKTVIKEMLNTALLPHFDIARSPRSWNSQTGVPLSAWQVTDNTTLAIFEAGISRPGEMEKLQQIIRPDLGVFTILTDEHDRGFESRRSKMAEKAILFKNCRTIFYLSGDADVDEILAEVCPDSHLVGCADMRDICKKVAAELGVQIPAGMKFPEVSTRVDIYDSPEGMMAAFDRFTCDTSSIATALDTVRRRCPAGMSLAVLLGDLQCSPDTADEAYSGLEKTLSLFGVTTVIAAGPEISRRSAGFAGKFSVFAFDSPSQAIQRLDIHSLYNHALYINGSDKSAFSAVYSWMSSRRNVTRLEINLDALAHNFRHYRSILPAQTGLVGMVKADAYGCGALEVARTLQSAGADMVAVAVVDEGVALRTGGVSLPIMVLDPWCENMQAIFACDLQPTLIDSHENIIRMLEDAASAQGVDTIRVHVKLDTGMHRVGLSEDELPEFINMLSRHPRIHVESTFSHLATADCLHLEDYTQEQIRLFERMSAYLCRHLNYPVRRHLLNTAGISRYGRDHVYELARLGIGLYGITPLDEADRRHLRPVARLVTRIIATRHYEAGAKIGYGCHGEINRPSVVGTIPIGYADGIDRRLGNGGARFLVNGHLCPTIGNICMDLCMIDLTGCPDIGDGTVEIFGTDIPIETLSDTLGTIPYEILARISPRVKRIYFRE